MYVASVSTTIKQKGDGENVDGATTQTSKECQTDEAGMNGLNANAKGSHSELQKDYGFRQMSHQAKYCISILSCFRW